MRRYSRHGTTLSDDPASKPSQRSPSERGASMVDVVVAMIVQAVSDWSIVIISTLPPSLTGSKGVYFRVVGIHSDG